MDEFDREARKWAKRMQSMPTHMEVMSDGQQVQEEINALKVELKSAAGDAMRTAILEERLKERVASLAEFRREMPKAIEQLDRQEVAS